MDKSNMPMSIPMPDDPKKNMTIIGTLHGHDEILVVSVPPRGGTMFYCQAHDHLFTITGPWCPKCSERKPSPRTIPI
jgi:hypothetical protein